MGRLAHRQKSSDMGTLSRPSRAGGPSVAREARGPVFQPTLIDSSLGTPTLTPFAQHLLSEELPLSREAPRLPYNLPLQPVARQAPTPLRAEPAGTAHAEEEKEAADRAAEEAGRKLPGNGIIQSAPLPEAPPDHPQTGRRDAKSTPKAGAPAKPGDRTSSLHARNAEIQDKLALFREQ